MNNNLLIPPLHLFPVLRLLMWFGIGAVGFREAYEDFRTWGTDERKVSKVEGRYRWLATAILSTEAILCWKYRENTGHIHLDAVTPFYIWFPWLSFHVWMFGQWIYLRFRPNHTTKYPFVLK